MSREHGIGRGVGRGQDSLESWNPSWLRGSDVSPPSFGVVQGRGRANLLNSLVQATAPRPVGGSIGTARDVQFSSTVSKESSSSDESSDELCQLQQDHADWKEQMELMAERGRLLEVAIKSHQQKHIKKKVKTKKELVHQTRPPINNAAVPFSSPIFSSTHAAGTFGMQTCMDAQDELSCWLRPRRVCHSHVDAPSVPGGCGVLFQDCDADEPQSDSSRTRAAPLGPCGTGPKVSRSAGGVRCRVSNRFLNVQPTGFG